MPPAAPGAAPAAAGAAPAGVAPAGAPGPVQYGQVPGQGQAAAPPGGAAAQAIDLAGSAGPVGPYPGDGAPKSAIAAWMGNIAQKNGLPRELPVMAALVESSLHNDAGGDRDSVGYFQMRVGIWNNGAYAGYPNNPQLQVKWFIDQALAVKRQRLAGDPSFGHDPSSFGDWIADIERPAAEYRGRYQLQLGTAQSLLGGR
jgi:hypothetical protein